MNDTYATAGIVGTEPERNHNANGLAVTTFRLAASTRKFNRDTMKWEYGDSNWFTVKAFRHLADNLAQSVHKGDRVVVSGRIGVNEWQGKDGNKRTVIELVADSIGHDLSWGTAVFTKATQPGSPSASSGESAESAWPDTATPGSEQSVPAAG